MLIGIVGAPNSGKSTFFRAVTLTEAEIANYPFTTIKPNQGVGYATSECPCRKLGVSCSPQNSRCLNGTRMIPVKLLDVAGLVPGAHEGKGMGNQFLNDLSRASGLIHVLDASGRTDSEGKPSEGWDPAKTVKFLEYEIDEWISGIVSRALSKVKKASETQKIPLERLLSQQLSGLSVKEEHIKEALSRSGPEEHGFASEIRRLSKPMLVAANKIDMPSAKENLPKLGDAIPCSAEAELALRNAERQGLINYIPGSPGFEVRGDLTPEQSRALEFIHERVLKPYGSTGVQKAINTLVFGKLNMITVYPVSDIGKLSDSSGNVLPDAYLVPKGTTLREFAYMIHTDIGDSFIGGLDIGKRKIGADYVLKDGDVVEILARR